MKTPNFILFAELSETGRSTNDWKTDIQIKCKKKKCVKAWSLSLVNIHCQSLSIKWLYTKTQPVTLPDRPWRYIGSGHCQYLPVKSISYSVKRSLKDGKQHILIETGFRWRRLKRFVWKERNTARKSRFGRTDEKSKRFLRTGWGAALNTGVVWNSGADRCPCPQCGLGEPAGRGWASEHGAFSR